MQTWDFSPVVTDFFCNILPNSTLASLHSEFYTHKSIFSFLLQEEKKAQAWGISYYFTKIPFLGDCISGSSVK